MTAHDPDQSRADLAREVLDHGDRLSTPSRRLRGKRAIPYTDPLEADDTDWDSAYLRERSGWQRRGAE